MSMETPPHSSKPLSLSEALPREYWPKVENLITEDDEPVDNIYSEKQQRLLTEPLYSSWKPSVPFLVLANVGLFHSPKLPPYVPDVLLSLEAETPVDLFPKSNRSYFVWEYGKPPDVVIEVVSNQQGGEDSDKLKGYARVGVHFYIIYDPEQWLGPERLRLYELRGGEFHRLEGCSNLVLRVGLGVTLWNGVFEEHSDEWLRWTDSDGKLLPTGAERAETERARADAERARADAERARADAEQLRAEAATKRAAVLAEEFNRLGRRLDQSN
jgi:Uma2 family endonuclease